MLRIKIIYVVFSLALSFVGQAQTNPASQKAQSLLSNVVHIKAEQDVGFGFITGERDGKLYVVTAAHVLMDGNKMEKAAQVQFYQIQGTFSAKVVLEDRAKDLAMVEVAKPNGLTWQKNVRGRAAVGDFAAFVGRDGDWYVPLSNSVGNINRVEVNLLQVDINSVVPGTSGAPLITASGMVGMILDHSGYNSRVLDLQEIKRMLRRQGWPFQLTYEQYGLVRKTLFDEDGTIYSTKIMKDGKRWMTQNLNLVVENSWCYNNQIANCEKYGRLYSWESAKAACPLFGDGWRLPTNEEWSNLTAAYRNKKKDYRALIEGGSSGFAAQLGGWHRPDGSFDHAGTNGNYWSSSPYGSSNSWYYYFDQRNGQLYRGSTSRDDGFSVRCLQD